MSDIRLREAVHTWTTVQTEGSHIEALALLDVVDLHNDHLAIGIGPLRIRADGQPG